MVATVEENALVRKLFNLESIEITEPKDWAAIIEKLLDDLPLSSMRGFSSPTDVMVFLNDVYEITGHGYSAVDEFDTIFCDGLNEKKHVLFCFFLRKEETPRRLRLEYLCMSRDGSFYIAETAWNLRKDPDYNPSQVVSFSDKICYLQKITFRPTDVESVCNKYMFAIYGPGHLPTRSVGLAVCYKLLDNLSKTGRELSSLQGSVRAGARTVRSILQRVDRNYSY